MNAMANPPILEIPPVMMSGDQDGHHCDGESSVTSTEQAGRTPARHCKHIGYVP